MKWSKNCQSFCLDSEVFSGSAYDHACGGGTDVADCGGVTGVQRPCRCHETCLVLPIPPGRARHAACVSLCEHRAVCTGTVHPCGPPDLKVPG